MSAERKGRADGSSVNSAAFVAESAPIFGPVDPDYACGAAYCDDPACTTHGRRDDD